MRWSRYSQIGQHRCPVLFNPELDFTDLLRRTLAGERPFEEWIHAHGHSDAEIAEVYGVIDGWLIC